MEKKCKGCLEIFDSNYGHRKYCNSRCWQVNYYKNHKEKIDKYRKKWVIENPEKTKASNKKGMDKFRKEKPERFNELMMQGYYRNKEKRHSRSNTLKVMEGRNGLKKYNPLVKECRICKSKNNIEIHHEIYPTKTEEIKKAIDKGKIYYLCRDCHGRKSNRV